MGLLGDLALATRRALDVRALPNVETASISGSRALGFFSQQTWRIPPDRNLSDYLALYGQVGWLFAVVSRISDSVAQIPWKVVQVQADGDKVEVAKDHPAVLMLRKPNPQWSNYDLVRHSVISFLLTGECFWFLLRDQAQRARIIWTLPPHRMQVLPSDDIMQFIRGYVYITPIGDQVPIDPRDVVAFRMPNPLNIYRGLGPVQAAMLDVDSELFVAQYTRNFYFNNAAPGGIITVPGGWNEEEFERLKEQFESRHQGAENAGRIGILWGDMEWSAAEISARDLQLIEVRKLTRNNILGIFGVPLSVMGIVEDVNRANAEAGYYVYAKECVQPLLNMLKATIDQAFLPQFGEGLEVEFAHMIPENRELLLAEAVQGFAQPGGILTLNEARELLGLDVVEDGDWILLDAGDPEDEAEAAENADDPPAGGEGKAKPKAKGNMGKPAPPKPTASANGSKPGRFLSRKVRLDVKKVDARARERAKREAADVVYEVTDDPSAPGLLTAHEVMRGVDREAYGERVWRSMVAGTTEVERTMAVELRAILDDHVDHVIRRIMALMAIPRSVELDGQERRDFEDVLADWHALRQNIEVVIKKGMALAYQKGARVASQLTGRPFDLRRLHAEHYAEQNAGAKSTLVVGTQRKRLANFIEGALRTGANVRETAERIDKEFRKVTTAQANTIARTELTEAANRGAREQYRLDDIEKQEWYTSMDERVCPQCDDLHEEVVGIDENFSDGSDGPPAHANCRCTILPVFLPGQESSLGSEEG